MTIPWVPLLVAGLVAFATILALRRFRGERLLVDRPNERSLHVEPTPRIGGLGIAAGIVAGTAVGAETAGVLGLLLLALALCLVSFADDVRSLPALVRLGAHFAAAAAATALAAPALGIAGFLVATLAIAWLTNLYNFMDGADGLAGGMGLIGFGTFAVAAFSFGELALGGACAVIAAACAGFLPHNFPPARVFMGDAGSIPLGFLAGAFGLQGWQSNAWPAWFPLLVFSPFIVDASLTLVRRAARRERVWEAHRSHAYQRLVLGGWSHRRLAAWAYALMIAVALSALLARREGFMVQCGTILAWATLQVSLFIAIDRRASRPPDPERVAGPRAGQQ